MINFMKPAIYLVMAGLLLGLGCAASSRKNAAPVPAVAPVVKAEESFSSLMERLTAPVIQALSQDTAIKRVGVFMFTASSGRRDRKPSRIAKQLTDAFEQIALQAKNLTWIERARLDRLIRLQEKESNEPRINDDQKLSLGLIQAADAFVVGEYYVSPDAVYDSDYAEVTVYAEIAQTGQKLAVNAAKIRLKEFPRDAVRDEQNPIPPPRREDYDLIKRP
jgi:hypothetical protein